MVKHTDKRIYYSMGDVAEMFDLTPSLIRYWEGQFEILKPRRNKKGNRMFTLEDVDNLKKIHYLVKTKGMTLKGAEQYLEDRGEEVGRSVQIAERLMRIRSVLQEIRDEMDVNDDQNVREVIIERSSDVDVHIEKWGAEKWGTESESHDFEVVKNKESTVADDSGATEELVSQHQTDKDDTELVVDAPTRREEQQDELLGDVLGSMLDVEDIDSEYISAIASELTPEDIKAAKEVMETIAEMKKADEEPKPQATTQTLF